MWEFCQNRTGGGHSIYLSICTWFIALTSPSSDIWVNSCRSLWNIPPLVSVCPDHYWVRLNRSVTNSQEIITHLKFSTNVIFPNSCLTFLIFIHFGIFPNWNWPKWSLPNAGKDFTVGVKLNLEDFNMISFNCWSTSIWEYLSTCQSSSSSSSIFRYMGSWNRT